MSSNSRMVRSLNEAMRPASCMRPRSRTAFMKMLLKVGTALLRLVLACRLMRRSPSLMAATLTCCGQRVAQVWHEVHCQSRLLASNSSRWPNCTMRTISCGLTSAIAATGQPEVHF